MHLGRGLCFYGGFIMAFGSERGYKVKVPLIFSIGLIFCPTISIWVRSRTTGLFLTDAVMAELVTYLWALFHAHLAGGDKFILRHPTQLYATLLSCSFFNSNIFWNEKKKSLKPISINGSPPRAIVFPLMALHSLSRIFMEYFRVDFRGNLVLNLSISTWISVIFNSGSFIFLFEGENKQLPPL